MRFHHSTRRGRNRMGYHHSSSGSRGLSHSNSSTSRWSQLGYCRETNIHFSRRLPVEPPPDLSRPIHLKNEAVDELKLNRLSLHESDIKQELHQGDKQIKRRHRHHKRETEKEKEKEKETQQQQHQEQRQLASSGKIDMETARSKLVAQVEKHPFWSSKAARKMQLTSVEERRIYIYELISYCERRDLEWRYEPYRGGLVSASPFSLAASLQPMNPANVQQSVRQSSAELSFTFRPQAASSNRLAESAIESASPRGGGVDSIVSCSPTELLDANKLLTATPSADSFWSPSSGTASDIRLSPRHCPVSPTAASQRIHSTSTGRVGTTINCGSDSLSRTERLAAPSRELVWSVEADRPELRPEPFGGHVRSVELPDSSFVKSCHGCQGKGRLKCTSCYGVGYEVCISCSGKGTTKALSSAGSSSRYSSSRYSSSRFTNSASCQEAYNSRNSTQANGDDNDWPRSSDSHSTQYRRGYEPGGITSAGSGGVSAWVSEPCHLCHGAGQKRCWVCAGKSYNHCLGCLGSGQLRCYLNLTITWLNHRDESVINNGDAIIPRDRLRLCSGLLLLDESADRLEPLQRARIDGAIAAVANSTPTPMDETNQLQLASRRLLDKQSQTYRLERLIRQRQRVTQIECHVVRYEWKQRTGHFVIYGDERKVYIAKYPFKSFCNIT